jgi:hypothetical protein
MPVAFEPTWSGSEPCDMGMAAQRWEPADVRADGRLRSGVLEADSDNDGDLEPVCLDARAAGPRTSESGARLLRPRVD